MCPDKVQGARARDNRCVLLSSTLLLPLLRPETDPAFGASSVREVFLRRSITMMAFRLWSPEFRYSGISSAFIRIFMSIALMFTLRAATLCSPPSGYESRHCFVRNYYGERGDFGNQISYQLSAVLPGALFCSFIAIVAVAVHSTEGNDDASFTSVKSPQDTLARPPKKTRG